MSFPPTLPSQADVRDQFPALERELVFLENAGGSQVPRGVAERMIRYLTETYVQLGAGYPLSDLCTSIVDDAHAFGRVFVNSDEGEVVFGPSSTVLLNMLASCYGEILGRGDRVVLAESGHEANLGPWKRLEKRGVALVWWRVDPDTGALDLEELGRILEGGAALVALPHVSNLLGGILDLGAVTRLAHDAGARVVADGVAYAPHRAVDVRTWDVDWYVLSTYKVYGPHMAILHGRRDAFAELPSPNHFFVPPHELPYAFEPGGPNHEGCAAMLGLGEFLAYVAGSPGPGPVDRPTVERAFARMEEWERPLIERLLSYLAAREDVRVIGPASADDRRVGTISFVHASRTSREIAAALQARGFALRHGHMYAWHLCDSMGLPPDDGVVRVSFVHYNTSAEIEMLCEALDAVL